MGMVNSKFESAMFRRLLSILEAMDEGGDWAPGRGEYAVLAYRPTETWGEEICEMGSFDEETEILQLARSPDLHAVVRALIEHLGSIQQLEMARDFVGRLVESGIADAATDDRLQRQLTDESLRLFAYWALSFMSMEVERFEEEGGDTRVLFSWVAEPPYHDDGITIVEVSGGARQGQTTR